MVDVAKAAGVSQKTVSRVVNNEPYVRPHVRERVLEAARRLDYRPNSAARALISGRSHRIGAVSLGTGLYGPASVLIALQRAAESAGYSFVVATTREGEAARAVQQAVDGLLEQGVEGIVLSEPIEEGPEAQVRCPVPVVSLGRMPGMNGDSVMVTGIDGVKAGRLATEHLLSLGHETVWHVAGPPAWFAADDRMGGWREALEAHGAPQPRVLLGDWMPASGYAAGRVLAQSDATAVFVANDDMAIGVLRALADAGRRVPSDVSVVGFDDIPAAEYLRPRLTTMRQDFDALASTGLDLLVRRLERLPEPRDPTPDVHRLVVRESTGPPPGG